MDARSLGGRGLVPARVAGARSRGLGAHRPRQIRRAGSRGTGDGFVLPRIVRVLVARARSSTAPYAVYGSTASPAVGREGPAAGPSSSSSSAAKAEG